MTDKFHTPNVQIEERQKIKIESPTRTINLVFAVYGLIILVSSILYQVLGSNKHEHSKESNWTGIKIIRENLFFIPILLTILNLLVSYLVFNSYLKTKLKEEVFRNSYFTFLRKFKYFQFFKNLLLTLIFYMLYSLLYIPILREYNYRLSGHVLAVFFSSTMVLNMYVSINEMINNKIAVRTFTLFRYLIYFTVVHGGYCLIFTSAFFHSLSECVFSIIISVFYINLVNFLPVNFFLKQIFNPSLPRSKAENTISFN
jgi:hypothetical protein